MTSVHVQSAFSVMFNIEAQFYIRAENQLESTGSPPGSRRHTLPRGWTSGGSGAWLWAELLQPLFLNRAGTKLVDSRLLVMVQPSFQFLLLKRVVLI